jgi:hypothetical protein
MRQPYLEKWTNLPKYGVDYPGKRSSLAKTQQELLALTAKIVSFEGLDVKRTFKINQNFIECR